MAEVETILAFRGWEGGGAVKFFVSVSHSCEDDELSLMIGFRSVWTEPQFW